MTFRLSRRRFLTTAAASSALIAMPYLSRAADRPAITHGVQSGDVSTDSGMIWARADRPSQLMVEVSTTESFKTTRVLPPVTAYPEADFTAIHRVVADALPGIDARVVCVDAIARSPRGKYLELISELDP